MTVTVLLFASYAEKLGFSSLRLDLAPHSTVRSVLDRMREMAGPSTLPPNPLVAVNESYASAETVLSSGDEVAIIPPVAGG